MNKNNGQFKIESSVPAPPITQVRRNRYPLREMAIGDSFFVPNEAAGDAQVRSGCCYFQIRNKNYRFTIRKEPGGCRVWRISIKQKPKGTAK